VLCGELVAQRRGARSGTDDADGQASDRDISVVRLRMQISCQGGVRGGMLERTGTRSSPFPRDTTLS
jgi:hypothetical protein